MFISCNVNDHFQLTLNIVKELVIEMLSVILIILISYEQDIESFQFLYVYRIKLDSSRLREERDSCVNLLRKHHIEEPDIHCNRYEVNLLL